MNEKIINSPTNNQAILSLVFGILTIVSFCTGVVPFPLTGFICFPASILFGVLALVFGVISLNQIRRQNESGRPMAWMGIMLGGLVFLCLMCMVIAIASLFIFAPNSIHTPPFFPHFST
jgi:uncharacterized membrane protein HdeD (DUF308 family)